MRSALLAVDGVTRVQVLLAQGDVIVTYDVRKTTVDALISALDLAPGPLGPNQYEATVKRPPRPVPSGS